MILSKLRLRSCLALATIAIGLAGPGLVQAQSSQTPSNQNLTAHSQSVAPPGNLSAPVIEAGTSIQQTLRELDDWYLDQFDPITSQWLALMDPADGWLSPSTTVTPLGNQRAHVRYDRILDLLRRQIDLQTEYGKRLTALSLDPSIPASARAPFTDYLNDYATMFVRHRADAAQTVFEFLDRLIEQLDRNYAEVTAGRATLDGNRLRYTPASEQKALALQDDIQHWSREYQKLEQIMKREPPRPSQILWR